MKRSFEDKIRMLIKQKEKQDKVEIIGVDIVRIKRIGFKRDSEINVTYYTND